MGTSIRREEINETEIDRENKKEMTDLLFKAFRSLLSLLVLPTRASAWTCAWNLAGGILGVAFASASDLGQAVATARRVGADQHGGPHRECHVPEHGFSSSKAAGVLLSIPVVSASWQVYFVVNRRSNTGRNRPRRAKHDRSRS